MARRKKQELRQQVPIVQAELGAPDPATFKAFNEATDHEHFRIVIVLPTEVAEHGFVIGFPASAALTMGRIALQSINWGEDGLLKYNDNKTALNDVRDRIGHLKGLPVLVAVATKQAVINLACSGLVRAIEIIDMPKTKITTALRPIYEIIGMTILPGKSGLALGDNA